MKEIYKEIYQNIWQEVFPEIKIMPIEKAVKLFAFGIDLPIERKCVMSGKPVYIGGKYDYKKCIHEDAQAEKAAEEIEQISENVSGLADLMVEMGRLATFRGNRIENSEFVSSSDNIYSSNYIYSSLHLYQCQHVLFSEHSSQSDYLAFCRGASGSNFGMKFSDCNNCSSSFDIDWSGNVSNSYFIHDGFDLRDCMFCFHLRSKQYCIGNRQYTKEAYFELKQKILADYFGQIDKKGAFVTLRDIPA